MSVLLGVNIDHIATLRNARGGKTPSPVDAAIIAERHGADGITAHLREDRRHIRDKDLYKLKKNIQTRLNFEMAVTDEMIDIALDVKPAFVCLVPEKREELTTEGGLDVLGQATRVGHAVERLSDAGIKVSLFIDPDLDQIAAAKDVAAPFIELHTGPYAEGDMPLRVLRNATEYAQSRGLKVNAGHGLNYENVKKVAEIEGIYELNIGYSIVSEALFVGLDKAVKRMKKIIEKAGK